MKENFLKGVISLSITAITVYFKALVFPVIIFIVFMMIDYITGIINAWLKSSLSSKTGFLGILKKLCYLFEISVGVGIDYVITYGLNYAGINVELKLCVALILCVWLTICELISILENISSIGVKVPKGLAFLLTRLKNNVDNSMPSDNDGSVENKEDNN